MVNRIFRTVDTLNLKHVCVYVHARANFEDTLQPRAKSQSRRTGAYRGVMCQEAYNHIIVTCASSSAE